MSSTENTAKGTTLAAWKKNKTHTITVPSGTQIDISIPDLPDLVKTGVIPNELVDVAINVAEGKAKVTRDDIVKQADFYNKLAVLAVQNPKTTEDDWSSGQLPFEDKEMIIEIATRQRDLDAVGHHIGGLEKLSEFRRFRGITTQYEDLESL